MKLSVNDLFSEAGEMDEHEAVEVLLPHVIIKKDSREIFFKDSKLSSENRILVYALAKKLLVVKGMIEQEAITAKEVHERTGMKKGTVDPCIKRLRESGMLMGKGEYVIPAYKLPAVMKLIKEFSD